MIYKGSMRGCIKIEVEPGKSNIELRLSNKKPLDAIILLCSLADGLELDEADKSLLSMMLLENTVKTEKIVVNASDIKSAMAKLKGGAENG